MVDPNLIDERPLLALLSSQNLHEVLSGLRQVRSNRSSSFSDDVLCQIVALLSHRDAEVRQEAVRILGFNWSRSEVYPALVQTLCNVDEDSEVLFSTILAIGVLAKNCTDVRNQALRALLVFVRDLAPDEELRQAAYISAIWAADRVTPAEYARLSVTRQAPNFEWEWIDSVLKSQGTEKF